MGRPGVYIRTSEHRKKMAEIQIQSSAHQKAVSSPDYIEGQRRGSLLRKAMPPHPGFGDKHWNWQGGIAKLKDSLQTSFKYRQWRSDIFTRDNFTCQDCGQKISGTLEAHHLKSKRLIFQEHEITTLEQALACEELWNLNNGITLCVSCHRRRHNQKGV